VDLPRTRTESALGVLDDMGLVMRSPGRTELICCYAPADDRKAAVATLLRQYRQNLVGIVQLITENSLERMHHQTSDLLADAVLFDRPGGSERTVENGPATPLTASEGPRL